MRFEEIKVGEKFVFEGGEQYGFYVKLEGKSNALQVKSGNIYSNMNIKSSQYTVIDIVSVDYVAKPECKPEVKTLTF